MKSSSSALKTSSDKKPSFNFKKIHVLTLNAVFVLALAAVPAAPSAGVTLPPNAIITEADSYTADGEGSFSYVDLNQGSASITAGGSITGTGQNEGYFINLENAGLAIDAGSRFTTDISGGDAGISVENSSLEISSAKGNGVDLGNGNFVVYGESDAVIKSGQGSNKFAIKSFILDTDNYFRLPSVKISAAKNNEISLNTFWSRSGNITVWNGDLEISAGEKNIFSGQPQLFCQGYGQRAGSCKIEAGTDNIFEGENAWLIAASGNLSLEAGNSNIIKGSLVGAMTRESIRPLGSITLKAGNSNVVSLIQTAYDDFVSPELGVISLIAKENNDIGGGREAVYVPYFLAADIRLQASLNRLRGSDFAVLGWSNGMKLSLSAAGSNEINGGLAGMLFLSHTDMVSRINEEDDPDLAALNALTNLYRDRWESRNTMLGSNAVSLNAGESNAIRAEGSDQSVGIGIAGNVTVSMNAGLENRIYGKGRGAFVRAVAYIDGMPDDEETHTHTDLASLAMTTESGVNSVEGGQNGIVLFAQRQVVLGQVEIDGTVGYETLNMRTGDAYRPYAHSALAKAELTTDSGRNSIVSEGTAVKALAEKKGYVYNEPILSADELSEAKLVYYAGSDNRYQRTTSSEVGEASAVAVISAQSGDNEIVGGETAVSAEGYGTGDESAASVTVSTVSGRNTIRGGTAALSAGTNGRILVEGPSTVTGAVEAEGKAASIKLDYGTGSAVTGDLSAASGASVAFAPQDGGSLVLTGSAKTDASSTLALNLSADSLWYMTSSSSISSLSGSGSVVYQNGGDALEIGTLEGSHNFALDLSTTGSESDMLYIVNGTSEKQTLTVKNGEALWHSMAMGEAVRFATIKNAGGGFGDGTELGFADGPLDYILTINYRSAESDPLNTEAYNDAYNGDGTRKPTTEEVEATYGGEGSSNLYVVKTGTRENAGGRTAGAAGKLVWRYTTDMDTYTRRMAQSTEFMPGSENGAWLRAAYHRLEADGSGTLHGPFWELGFSGDVSSTAERTHRIGFSAGYTVQSGSWAHDDGSVRVKDATAAFYYTMLGAQDDTGASVSYWDNVLRYHHLRTHTGTYDEPSGATFDGNRTQEAVSLSTEYGRRIPLTETVTLTPQAQFQLTYVGGFDSTDSEGMRTEGDHDWSAVARIGADLSRRWGEGGKSSAYLKASLLHEFSDGQEIRVSGHSAASRFEHPGSARGSWAALGLGFNRRLGDKAYVYFDGETQIGSGRRNSYVFTGGFKYAF
jgi:outer membrane autotransporter protein